MKSRVSAKTINNHSQSKSEIAPGKASGKIQVGGFIVHPNTASVIAERPDLTFREFPQLARTFARWGAQLRQLSRLSDVSTQAQHITEFIAVHDAERFIEPNLLKVLTASATLTVEGCAPLAELLDEYVKDFRRLAALADGPALVWN